MQCSWFFHINMAQMINMSCHWCRLKSIGHSIDLSHMCRVMDLLELMAPMMHFAKLREFLDTKLPPGFPVKIGQFAMVQRVHMCFYAFVTFHSRDPNHADDHGHCYVHRVRVEERDPRRDLPDPALLLGGSQWILTVDGLQDHSPSTIWE